MPMYALKSILPVFEIEVPTCMYVMKSSVFKRDTGEMKAEKGLRLADLEFGEQFEKTFSTTVMSKLEERQNQAIEKLKELRSQLESMRSLLNACNKKFDISAEQDHKYEMLPDIVVNARPNSIPYALLALKNIWKDIFNIDVKCYTHSTIEELSPDAIEFQKQISVKNERINVPGIQIVLIWKNTEHTEMIASSTMYVPLYGEVNIIRYLTRVGPEVYRYEESSRCNDVDMILDICYQLMCCTTAKARQPLLRLLNNCLQNQSFFIGDQLSIADVAVSSSIKRTPDACKDLTDNMNKWLGRVQQVTHV